MRHALSDTAAAAQLLFVLALWAVYLGTELWKSQNERCTPGYFMAYGTQARHALVLTHQGALCREHAVELTFAHSLKIHLAALMLPVCCPFACAASALSPLLASLGVASNMQPNTAVVLLLVPGFRSVA